MHASLALLEKAWLCIIKERLSFNKIFFLSANKDPIISAKKSKKALQARPRRKISKQTIKRFTILLRDDRF